MVLREENDDSTLEALISAFRPHPPRSGSAALADAGQNHRDIADILGGSPRTVNKHLEHIFEKLGGNRTAAATLAVNRLRGVRRWRPSVDAVSPVSAALRVAHKTQRAVL